MCTTKCMIKAMGLLSSFCFALTVVAQPKPMKWGEVPLEDLEMMEYPADSNAAAVILCDYGDVWFDRDLKLTFERHTRVKILTEAGYDRGTVERSYYSNDKTQKFKDLKGQTFNLTEQGKVEKHELDKKSIFEEENGSWTTVKFTLPALKPGSVIEYRYKIESSSPLYFPDWSFQSSEPTRWSEFRSKNPQFFEYVSVFQGTETLDINEQKRISENYSWVIKSAGRLHNISDDFYAMEERRVMQDVPALRREPFMTTPADFQSTVRFQLARIIYPNSPVVPVLTTWAKLAEGLMDSNDFGGQIGRHKVLRERAESLVAQTEVGEDKMRAIYDDVCASMKWDGNNRVFCKDDLDEAYKKKQGNVAEINLMLVSMLQDVGLTAHPVIISTRSHGKIQPMYPLVNQFNSVLAYVQVDGKEYFLDATSPIRPHQLLPTASLNHIGYLIDKRAHRWVNIESDERSSRLATVQATLDEDGSISGRIQTGDQGYRALECRDALDEQEHDQFIRKELLSHFANVQLDSFEINHEAELEKPLQCVVNFTIPDFAQTTGDFIYLNPMLFEREEKNPFTLPERTFPVDFAYGRDTVYTLHLTLPEGYVLAEELGNRIVSLPNRGGEFRRVLQVTDGKLEMMSRLVISKTVFPAEEYPSLKEFYNHVVAAHAEQIVLKKATN